MPELASWRELLGKIIADSHVSLTPAPHRYNIMMQARRNSQPIHLMEAEQLVWQQIEEELFQSSLRVAKNPEKIIK